MSLIPMKIAFGMALAVNVMSASVDALPGNVIIKNPGPVGIVSGTGKHPAIAVVDGSMLTNTLYMPEKLPQKKMPLVLWGNGGCRNNGLRYSQFLREVASHGFFIIAAGYPIAERDLQPQGSEPNRQARNAADDLPDTTSEQLIAAIDWAKQQTESSASPYYGKIDISRIGVMGTSCGGLQAISVLTDSRVKTGIAFNSGILLEPPPGHMSANMNLHGDKSLLEKLNGPIAYINGGPSDIAYKNALDDMARISQWPVFFGENGVGHGGTYLFDEHGGEYAQVATAWMLWQLKGDKAGAKWFEGKRCVLCKKSGWSVKKKNIK